MFASRNSAWPFVLMLVTAAVLFACSSTPVEPRVSGVSADDAPAYIRDILTDEPVAYWRLAASGGQRVEGAVEADSDAATRFASDDKVVLDGMSEFHKYAFTVEMWVRAPRGRILSYANERQPYALVLDYREELRLTIAGERVRTGVELGERWQHLSVAWDGQGGHAVVAVDGQRVWSSQLARGKVLHAGGRLLAGEGALSLDELAWYDRFLHAGRFLRRVNLARGEPYLTTRVVRAPLDMGLTVGHADDVVSLGLSPDGRVLASATPAGEIKVWDPHRGVVLRTIEAGGRIDSVVVSPDSRLLASSGGDAIKVWDLRDGKLVKTFEDTSTVHAFSPDGAWLVVGTSDGKIRLLDSRTGRARVSLASGPEAIRSIALDPEGARIVALNAGNEVYLWDIRTARKVRKVGQDKTRITSIELSPNGDVLAAGTHRGTVELWDLASGELVRTLAGHRKAVLDLAFSPFGSTLAASAYGEMKFWDWKNGREIDTLDAPQTKHSVMPLGSTEVVEIVKIYGEAYFRNMQFGPRGGWLVAARGTELVLVNSDEAKVRRSLSSYRPPMEITSLDLSPDGRRLAVARRDRKYARIGGDIELWRVGGAPKLMADEAAEFAVECVAISPDSQMLARCVSDTSRVALSRIEPRRPREQIKTHVETGSRRVRSVAFSPDGRILAAGGEAGTVRLSDLETGRELHTVGRHVDQHSQATASVTSLGFSHDGSILATAADFDDAVKLWDTKTGAGIVSLEGHPTISASLAWAPSSMKLAVGGAGEITLWERKSNWTSRTISAVESYPTALSFSPDGKILASGGDDSVIDLWEVATGRRLARLHGHHDDVTAVEFAPNGKTLVSGSKDGTVKLWNVETERSVTLIADRDLETEDREWLAYTNDGYFDASTRGAELVSAVEGVRSYSVEQLALSRNRPDILMQRVGMGSSELIAHYENEWKRRLDKAGVSQQQLSAEADLPDAGILRSRTLEEKPGVAEIIFEFRDSVGLGSYQIYVDNVPLFAGYGKAIAGKRVQLRREVPLTDGLNKIEISALNTRGQESMRASSLLEYRDPKKGDLYYVGFGVSDYKSKLVTDLDYAHRDAKDLEALLDKATGQFRKVHKYTRVNAAVDVDSIRGARKFLAQTKPRDTVVLFVAGHGLYDTSDPPIYYYLTHDAELDNLAETAAEFALIESLLDGIAARNKLFLLDTCQSGESPELAIAKDGSKQQSCGASRGLKARTTHRSAIGMRGGPKNFVPREYLLDRDRFIYRDLRRRTGAIVFSSSMGSEASYEHPEFENGAFTEAIAEALSSGKADTDDDGLVTTDELRAYVRDRVPALTGDCQHPTVDRDNLYRTFSMPVVR